MGHVNPHFAGPRMRPLLHPSADDITVEGILHALSDPVRADLFARIAHGTGQTILREALLVADHNAYHVGQVILVRRILGAWKQSQS